MLLLSYVGFTKGKGNKKYNKLRDMDLHPPKISLQITHKPIVVYFIYCRLIAFYLLQKLELIAVEYSVHPRLFVYLI